MMTVLPASFLLSWATSALHNSPTFPTSPTSPPLPTGLAQSCSVLIEASKIPFPSLAPSSLRTLRCQGSPVYPLPSFHPSLCTHPAPAESWSGSSQNAHKKRTPNRAWRSACPEFVCDSAVIRDGEEKGVADIHIS